MKNKKTTYEEIIEIVGEVVILDEVLTIISKKHRPFYLGVIDFSKKLSEQEPETLDEILKLLK